MVLLNTGEVMKRVLLLGVLILVLIVGCGKEKSSNGSLGIDSAEYHYTVFEKSYGDCNKKESPCATIKLSYPVFDGNYDPFKNKNVNYVDSLILKAFFEGESYPSIDSLKNDFMGEYKRTLEEFDEFVQRWSLERGLEVIYNNGSLMSFKFHEFSFTGGAHPNYYTILFTFDISNTRMIAQNEVIKPDALPKMNEIAEKKFREVRGLKPDEDLAEAGFWFDEGKFKISENFALVDKGLLFFYNSYDIAPYAMGTTELLLTYDKLKGLINEKVPQN